MGFWHVLWPTGLFSNAAVVTAFRIGSAVAVVNAVVGVFVVIRGQAFSGHALGDVGATGAAGAYLAGITALWGFLAAGFSSGMAIESLGHRVRERDVATGVVLAFMLGLSALFLYLISALTETSGAPIAILFGSLFTVAPGMTGYVLGLSLSALLLLGIIFRPLLFSSVTPDVARVRGVSPRLVGLLFMVSLVVAVEESALVVGALLSTALLIGPAAIATKLSRQPLTSMALAMAIGVFTTWLGIILAYDSFLWPPLNRGWPISFFITSLMLLSYLAVQIASGRQRRSNAATALTDFGNLSTEREAWW